jgi:hypothetical protein
MVEGLSKQKAALVFYFGKKSRLCETNRQKIIFQINSNRLSVHDLTPFPTGWQAWQKPTCRKRFISKCRMVAQVNNVKKYIMNC